MEALKPKPKASHMTTIFWQVTAVPSPANHNEEACMVLALGNILASREMCFTYCSYTHLCPLHQSGVTSIGTSTGDLRAVITDVSLHVQVRERVHSYEISLMTDFLKLQNGNMFGWGSSAQMLACMGKRFNGLVCCSYGYLSSGEGKIDKALRVLARVLSYVCTCR